VGTSPKATTTAFVDVPRRQGKALDMRTLNRSIAWRRQIAIRHAENALRFQPTLRVTACPACDGAHHSPFLVVYGFNYHECDSCGHLFVENPPAPAEIASLYKGAPVPAGVYDGDELFKRRVEQIARPKAEFCRATIQPEGHWFDVGCGTGELLSVVREAGWIPRGCDADPAYVSFARRQGIDVIEGYVDELPAELAGSVRVISALNVLEHVPDPKRWLARLTGPLVSGAHLVLEVPRHPSISSFSNLLYPDLASRHIYPPDHLHIFSEASLEHVLDACGFKARALWVFGQDFQELIYSSAAHAGLAESAFLHRILDASGAIQAAIDSQNLCDVQLVIAQKR
jgi:SAM-dependent methyltransferase